MKFDFDKYVEKSTAGNMRYLTTTEKVRNAGLTSFSGAEMDFPTAPCIIDAMKKRAESGLYGYTLADDEYFNAIIGWMHDRRNWDVKKEWIVPTYGTMNGFTAAINRFTNPGEGIIHMTPVYYFYRVRVELNGRKMVDNRLKYENGVWSIDFENLEALMAEPTNTALILCNPHNPISKVWSREELTKIAVLAKKYDVLVISDEIFAEVTADHVPVVPYSSIPEAANNSITFTSLGKAFDFTGITHANAIIPGDKIRGLFIHQRDAANYASLNPFMRDAIIAAYNGGAEWLDAMLDYVAENVRITREFFETKMPMVKVCPWEGTFLVCIDWNALGLDEEELHKFLIEEALLISDAGGHYGAGGECFTRMNMATPRSMIEKVLQTLEQAAKARNFI